MAGMGDDLVREARKRARLTQRDSPRGPGRRRAPFSHSAESLAASGTWNLTTRFGDLDISFVPHGTTGYDDLVRDANDVEVASTVVSTASLADIVRSKATADGDKDKRVLPTLRRLLAEQ